MDGILVDEQTILRRLLDLDRTHDSLGTGGTTDGGGAAGGGWALDQLCEQLADALIDAGREPEFVIESPAASPHGDPVAEPGPLLMAAQRYWSHRFAAAPTVETAMACAAWLSEHLPAAHRRDIELAWAVRFGHTDRGHVETAPEIDRAATRLDHTRDTDTGSGSCADLAWFATVYHGSKLRGGLRFTELHHFLTTTALAAATGTRGEEPMVLALRGFAAFGHPDIDPDHAVELMERAWTQTERSRPVVEVCLAGLDLAAPFAGQMPLLARYTREAVALYPDDPVMHYRLANALSATATSPDEHRQALAAIDHALALPPPAGLDDNDVRAHISACTQRR